MVTIFEKNTTTFNSLGLGTLSPTSCIVEEEINGAYELKLKHPYDEWNKWKRIENSRILLVSTPKGTQPFRIYNVVPDMEGISVNARHIFYDLLDNECSSISFSGTAFAALQTIKNAMAYTMPFNFYTDISISGTLETTRMNPVSALLSDGDETTSFIKGFGGELDRDEFNVNLQTAIGQNRDVTIRYGKNLIGLEVTLDESNVKTRINYVGSNGSGTLDSPYINDYVYPKIYTLEDEEKTTSELQTQAQALFDSGLDLPLVNIKVNFVELSKTVEYKNYSVLESVFIGDVVTIINEKMGFSKQARVISYEWNSLLEQYERIELGDFLPSLAGSVTSGVNSGSLASSAYISASAVMTSLQSHLQDKNNPHDVTAEQVGANETVQQVVGSNPNLLDNWNFADPINQRGQTAYTSGGYTIDRWYGEGDYRSVCVNDDFITLRNSETGGGNAWLAQFIENPWEIAGRNLTASILFRTDLSECVLEMNSSEGHTAITLPATDGKWMLVTHNFSLADTVTQYRYTVFVKENAIGSIDIKAVKLELGSEQTLARQENGVWVLNEIPDYGEQLLRCQRYFQRFRTEADRRTYCEDFRPTMRMTDTGEVSKSTITVDGVTYYTASADL